MATTESPWTLAFPQRAGWEPGFVRLAESLGRALQVEVRPRVAREFGEVRDWVVEERVQIGVLTSTGYAQATRMEPRLQYLVTARASEGGAPAVASYSGALIVRKDSGLTRLSDLRGQPFAFVTPSSSSGFKYPVVALEREGIDYRSFFGTVMYVGDHPYVTDAVAANVARGGATWDGNLAKARAKHGDVFAEVSRYGPIVNHALVAARTVPASRAEAAACALVATPADVLATPGFPYAGFERLDDHAYDEARRVERLERRLTMPASSRRAIPAGDFQRVALEGILGALGELRIELESRHMRGFVKREPTPLITYRTPTELADELGKQVDALAQAFPAVAGALPGLVAPLVAGVADRRRPTEDLLGLARELLQRLRSLMPPRPPYPQAELSVAAAGPEVFGEVSTDALDSSPPLAHALADDMEGQRMIAAASALLQRRRRERSARAPADRPVESADERLALQIVYALLDAGAVVRGPYQPLGISGFREIQTYLFNTDPGEGHIAVSCADLALMRGTTIHIEHIDRDKEFNKEKVEAYRLPAAVNAARVRLHVGADAPASAYIGRPVFESGTYRLDLLKAVHMTASACTAMFMNGIADCKIAIEHMTMTEAVEFMRAVVGNVIRDRSKQYLAAAFNINTPLVDDRPETVQSNGGKPARLTDPLDIARLSIVIARLADFDKVTWDGASNEVPSRPIIGLVDRLDRAGQLTHAQVCQLVHAAHEGGLNTYVSAGLEAAHMRDAVWAGLDGVGIGTSLHFIDPDTKLMGALRGERIAEALKIRDDAERGPMGRAAVLLARADRMFFERTLPVGLDAARRALFAAVVDRDEESAARARAALSPIEELPSDGQPVVAHALRFLHATESASLLRDETAATRMRDVADDVRRLLALGDLGRLAEVLSETTARP